MSRTRLVRRDCEFMTAIANIPASRLSVSINEVTCHPDQTGSMSTRCTVGEKREGTIRAQKQLLRQLMRITGVKRPSRRSPHRSENTRHRRNRRTGLWRRRDKGREIQLKIFHGLGPFGILGDGVASREDLRLGVISLVAPGLTTERRLGTRCSSPLREGHEGESVADDG